MGSIDIIQPLSTVPSIKINLSCIKRENSLECWESNPGGLGEKQVCYLCAMQTPVINFSLYSAAGIVSIHHLASCNEIDLIPMIFDLMTVFSLESDPSPFGRKVSPGLDWIEI